MNGHGRRRVLVAGASIALGAGLGGCLSGGDDGQAPPDGTGTETLSLGIEGLELATGEPAGYREYRAAEDGTYSPGDVVWFYLEPVGVTTGDAGAGEERIDLTGTLTVTGPDGTELETTEETFDREIPEGGTEELYMYFHFAPDSPVTPGEYTAEIVVRDELAGTEARETITFAMGRGGSELDLEHVRFVEGEPAGYREYTPVEDPVYAPNDEVWIYFEPVGVGVEMGDDDQRRIELSVRVTTTGPDGEELPRVRDTVERPIPDDRDLEELFLFVNFELQRPATGDHAVEIAVRDRISRSGASATTSFTVAEEGTDLVGVFRDAVAEEVTVDRLALREAVLRLHYHSGHAFGESAFTGEVGYIAGVYAAVVDEGLDADRLRATGRDAEDQEFVFEVESRHAQAWMDGEITEEEYVDHVLESLRLRGGDRDGSGARVRPETTTAAVEGLP